MKAGTRGFSLVELTGALVAIVGLALILPPVMATVVNQARVDRAREDVVRVANAIQRFHEDLGTYPQWLSADHWPAKEPVPLELLVSPGDTPKAVDSAWLRGTTDTLNTRLNTPESPGPTPTGWQGPYLVPEVGSDPWHNRYIVDMRGLNTDHAGSATATIWVVSAGTNGVIESSPRNGAHAGVVLGDDVAVVIRARGGESSTRMNPP